MNDASSILTEPDQLQTDLSDILIRQTEISGEVISKAVREMVVRRAGACPKRRPRIANPDAFLRDWQEKATERRATFSAFNDAARAGERAAMGDRLAQDGFHANAKPPFLFLPTFYPEP
jgi:hypothetical protein